MPIRGCRPFTQKEYEDLKACMDKRDHCLLVLGVRTGFRISELLSLNTEDVLGNTIMLRKRNTKGKIEGRIVPMHPEAANVVLEYLAGRKIGPLFLSYQGKRLSRISAHEAIKKACTRAKICDDGLATHSMRKTFAKNMYEALHKDLFALQYAMGHSDIQTTVKYLNPSSEEVWNAIKNAK